MDAFLGNKRRGHIATLIFDKGEALLNKSRGYSEDSNSIRQAIQSFKVADQFSQKIKTEQSDVKSKLFWRRDRRKLYESAIEACFMDGNVKMHFTFLKESRGSAFVRSIERAAVIKQ